MPAQDPSEPFDLVDADGRPLGRTKARSLVHRDGDWHRSLHLWVVLASPGDDARVLFQRRSLAKDTQPGALDLAVAGHLGAGETVYDALREAREEIGLDVEPKDVTRLGVRKRAYARGAILDREIQEVFVTVTGRALSSFTPDPDEVSALLALPLGDARRLADRPGREAFATLREAPGAAERTCRIASEDLAQDDHYFAVALASIEGFLRGERPPPWTLP